MEILDLNDAQRARFLKAYDITKLVLERLKIDPSNDKEREEVLELDELQSGYPRMTLTHLYDIAMLICARGANEQQDPFLETPQFFKDKDALKQTIAQADPTNIASWRTVQGRINGLFRR